MAWGLAQRHQSQVRQVRQVHSLAQCYVDLVRKDRLRVLADGLRRNTASRHARGNWSEDAPHGEMVGMGHYSKRHDGLRGPGHSLVGNYGLVPVDSSVRSPRCVRRSC